MLSGCFSWKRRGRIFAIGTLLGSIVGSGCGCGKSDGNGNVPTVDELNVQIIAPAPDVETITSQDDINPTDGIQYNVIANVGAGGNGQTFVLTNSEQTDGSGAPLTVSAVASGGQVTFSGYTLPEGEAVTLRVVEEGFSGSDCAASNRCDETTVRVVESFCEFFAPENDAVLTNNDDLGDPTDLSVPFQTNVLVDCFGIEDTDNVTLRVNGGRALVAQPGPDELEVKRVTFNRVALAEGPNILTVVPKTDADGENPQGAPSSITVTVDTGRCSVALFPADGSRILADSDLDLDPINGMQAQIDVVTNCAESSTVELQLQAPGESGFTPLGLTPSSTQADPDGTRFRFDSVNLPESVNPFDVVLQALVTESGGGQEGASVPSAYWVDSLVPVLVQTAPGQDACFGPASDVDPGTDGIQVNGFGSTSGSGDGSEVWVRAFNDENPPISCATDAECSDGLRCRAEFCRAVTTVTGGIFTFQSLTLPAGVTTVEYVATDRAGNQTTPEEVTLTVFDVGPEVSISVPSDGALLGPANDADGSTAGVQLTAEIAITNESFASNGTFTISGQSPVTFDPSTAVSGVVSVPISLQDGARSLRARVEDSCGEEVASDPVNVSVDSTPSEVVVRGFVGPLAERNRIADGGGTQSATVDLDVVVGLAQADRTVTITRFSAVDTSDGRVCSGTGTPISTNTVVGTSEGLLESGVSLNEGVNCFTVDSDGGFGVASEVYVVRRVTAAPTLTFSDPVDSSVLDMDSDGGATPEFNYDVSLAFGAASPLPGTVSLSIADGAGSPVNVAQTATAADDSTVLFNDVSLPAGPLQLSATFTDSAGNESTAGPIDVMVNNGAGPQFAIRLPEAGSLNARSTGTVDVELVDLGSPITTNLTCDLTVNGTDANSPTAWADTATPLTLAATVGEGIVTIVADCDDGNAVGYSQAVSFEVEDDVPATPVLTNEPLDTPGRLVFDAAPGAAFVNSLTEDQSGAPGLQHDIRLEVDTGALSIEDWTAELVVDLPDATQLTYSVPLNAGSPASAVFSSVEFGADPGAISFTATIIDSIGRRSLSATATLTIDREPPVFVQTAPDPGQALFTREDDETADFSFVDLTFTYNADVADDGLEARLEIIPAPQDLDPAGQVFTATVSGGVANFGRIPFEDDFFSAVATLTDDAGNTVQRTQDFEVRSLTPRVQFSIPDAPALLNGTDDSAPGTPGFQGEFRAEISGLEPGATVRVCSTLDPTGGSGVPCEFGTAETGTDSVGGGTLGEPTLRGFVVANGFSAGALNQSSAFFGAVALAQGEQWIHFEAEEADLDPQVSSRFFRFVVDSEGPVVTGFTFPQNDTGNDPTGEIALAASEGAVESGELRTPVSVTVTGAEDGAPVEILTSIGADPINATSATLSGGSATFDILLSPGAQLVTVRVADAAGNFNNVAADVVGPKALIVDLAAPTANLPEPTLNPYSSLNGSIDLGATPDPADDRLLLDAGVGVSIQVNDDQDLDDGTIVLRSFSDSGRTAQLEEQTLPIGSGVTNVPAFAFPFAAGANYLRAIVTDSVGNSVTIDTTAAYVSDFRGPALDLEVRDNGGTPISGCDTFPGCTVATAAPPVMGDPRTWLDPAVNDLFYQVQDCVSFATPSVETCPVSGRLESRIVTAMNPGGPTDTRPFSPVTGGAIQVNDTAFTSFSAAATGELFDPGDLREVRLVATDANGNRSVSNSVFLDLSIDGVIITVERLASGAPSGDVLENDEVYGIDQNEDDTEATFLVDYRVTVEAVSDQLPDSITLTASSSQGSNTGMMTVDVSGSGTPLYVVDVIGVELAESTGGTDIPNTISVSVVCGAAGACGERFYDGVLADTDPPVYEFDRCSLCEFNVPFSGDDVELCALACNDPRLDDAEANIEDPTVARAVWNAALDADGNPSNGFSTSGARPLVVRVTGADQTPLVELTSSQGGLSGNQVSGSCVDTDCTATFANMNAPTLANGLFHEISVSFLDRAGNEAVAAPNRIVNMINTEMIAADTDVTAPPGTEPTVCIGESTTPSAVADPVSDPATYEEPSCTASCTSTGLCSRRDGEATLTFTAPGDDGAGGDRVDSYEVHAFALETDYGGTSYSNCGATIDPDSAFETTVVVTPTVDPGELETATITGLDLPRAYCFVVEAIDDLGNSSPLTSFATERVFPWLTDVPSQGGPDIVAFDPTDPDIAQTDAFAAVGDVDFGLIVENLGDMDGDGRDDLGIVDVTSGARSVSLYFSRDNDLSTASVVLSNPTGADSFFGNEVAAGDFDGDGLNDLAVASPTYNTAATTNGGGEGGAIWIWWGVDGQGIRRDSSTDPTSFPSINPDVALFGRTLMALGFGGLVFADLDGSGGDELIFTETLGFTVGQVVGYSGDKTRFGGSPPTPTILEVDLSVAGGTTNRPDFRIAAKPSNNGSFQERELGAGDFNGDGFDDLAISDYGATHADGPVCDMCGEVYIYAGGASSIVGQNLAPTEDGSGRLQTGGALVDILRYIDGSATQFGFTTVSVPDPTGATTADWLFVSAGALGQVAVFRGGTAGLTPDTPASLPAGSYETLVRDSSTEAILTNFGSALCASPNPETELLDVMVLPFASDPAALYGASVYQWTGTSWEATSVVAGRGDFGRACAGAGNYVTTQQSAFVVGVSNTGAAIFLR